METPSPKPSGSYRLIAEKFPMSPIMFKAVLESWCYLNCTGGWDAQILVSNGSGDSPERMRLDLHTDDDAVLFMLSPEYGYMGRPRLNPLTS